MQKLRVNVTQEDIDGSNGYMSNENCPIARAIRREYPDIGLKSVGGHYFRTKNGEYSLPLTDEHASWVSSGADYPISFDAVQN